MTTTKTSETAAKKDVAKLQRAIVDGLESVKAQDIQVFDTEHLSPLFERVIVASGTSNRQTKALAASVRDKVKEAGFPKPRTEGEDNGEWIIVDCGAAVAHIMQPTIRQYYRLEDLWGDTPVRLKLGAAKPVAPEAKVPVKTAARRAAKAAEAEGGAPAKKTVARKPAAGRAGTAPGTSARTTAKAPLRAAARATTKPGVAEGRVADTKASAKPRAAAGATGRVTVRTPAKAAVKAAVKTPVKAPAKAAMKSAAKVPTKTPTKAPSKTATVKTLVVKPRSLAAPAKKGAPATKAPAAKRSAASKTAPAAKTPARKAPGRKA